MDDTNDIRGLQLQIALYDSTTAYRALYELLYDKLKRFCFSFVKSGEVAEEIVSDVFIKLWLIRNRLPEIDNLRVYLYSIAKNYCLNHIAKNCKYHTVSLDTIEFDTAVHLGSPEELCISADMVNKIRQAIAALPPKCRLIFRMVKEDGLPYKEVAGILQVSVLTVRNQVAIATRKIAETLPSYIDDKR